MALSATALTETAAFTAAIYPPQTGTDVEADDVGSGEQALANRTRYLYEKWHTLDVQSDHDLTTPGATLHTITAGAGYSTITGPEITVTGCEVGDVLEIHASTIGSYTGGTGASIRFRVEEDSASTPTTNGVPGGYLWFPPGSTNRRESNAGLLHTITDAGTARVYWEGEADATDLVLNTQVLFTVKHLRDHT